MAEECFKFSKDKEQNPNPEEFISEIKQLVKNNADAEIVQIEDWGDTLSEYYVKIVLEIGTKDDIEMMDQLQSQTSEMTII